jgi:hypothetical protein
LKRYKVAKEQGLAWQVVLVADAETDLKLLIRDCVLRGETLPQINNKVTAFIREVVDELESEAIKEKVKQSFPMFATRLYYKWLMVFGTQAMAVMFLNALKSQKTAIPKRIEEELKAIPKQRELSVYTPSLDAQAYNRATPNGMYNLDYEKEIQRRINEIADMTAKTDYASRYSLRASVEMQVREEHNKKQIQDLKDNGVRLAWIDTHANCSERCQPWQGKLYSLDGLSGMQDGVSYQPLEKATEIYDKYGYKNGCLSGFNCRHRLLPYRKGFRPIAIPESVMKAQRELERQQRYMERTIRRYESRALMSRAEKQTRAYKHYKGLVKEWTERYERFSRTNNIPFYPSRLDI